LPKSEGIVNIHILEIQPIQLRNTLVTLDITLVTKIVYVYITHAFYKQSLTLYYH